MENRSIHENGIWIKCENRIKYYKIITLLTFMYFKCMFPTNSSINWFANKIFDDSANRKRESWSHLRHIAGMFLFLFTHYLRTMFLWQHEYDDDTECIMFSSSQSTDQIRCAWVHLNWCTDEPFDTLVFHITATSGLVHLHYRVELDSLDRLHTATAATRVVCQANWSSCTIFVRAWSLN